MLQYLIITFIQGHSGSRIQGVLDRNRNPANQYRKAAVEIIKIEKSNGTIHTFTDKNRSVEKPWRDKEKETT